MLHGKQYGTEIIYILSWTLDLVGYGNTAHTNMYKQYKYTKHITLTMIHSNYVTGYMGIFAVRLQFGICCMPCVEDKHQTVFFSVLSID